MGLITVQIKYGFGRPAYYLTEHQFQEFMKYSYGEWLQVRVFYIRKGSNLRLCRPLRL